MPTFSSPSSDPRSTLTRSLCRTALRQTATLRAACAAATHAPTLDDCAAAVDRLREELERLEDSVEAYRASFGADLREHIAQDVAQLPLSQSWLDASIAQLVLGLASQLETSQRLAATSGVERLLWRLAQDREHVDAARAALAELRASPQAAVNSLARWLPVALETLEADVHAAFLETLRRDLAVLGLALEAHHIIAA